jgi:predicted transposase YbfD/YdcC
MKYRYDSLTSLAEKLSSIDDPRADKGKRHRLIDVLILAIFGTLWGHTDFTNMARDLKYNECYFTELLGLKNGIPSHDTFSAVFGAINPAMFLESFELWIAETTTACGKHIAIDGKAVRAATAKIHNGNIPYIVNAFIVEMGLCIAQVKVDEKTNEIKGIPDILDWLDLSGSVVTIDAIGCQKEIVGKLVEKECDFVLPAKGNQPNLHSDIHLEMETKIAESELLKELRKKSTRPDAYKEDPLYSDYMQTNKDHGRIERRSYHVYNSDECIDKEAWPDVKSVGMVKRERMVIRRNAAGDIIDEAPSMETETYIMSRPMPAEEFACYVRGHWRIENSLHWILDDFFREDRCTARVGKATENLAMLRKIVLNIMKADRNAKGLSMKAKQIYYRNEPDALAKFLLEAIPNQN